MAQESLAEQQNHDFLAQYARMMLKPQVHVRPCPKLEKLGQCMDQQGVLCLPRTSQMDN